MTKLNSIIVFTLEHSKTKSFECSKLGLSGSTFKDWVFLLQQRIGFYSINASMRMTITCTVIEFLRQVDFVI